MQAKQVSNQVPLESGQFLRPQRLQVQVAGLLLAAEVDGQLGPVSVLLEAGCGDATPRYKEGIAVGSPPEVGRGRAPAQALLAADSADGPAQQAHVPVDLDLRAGGLEESG